MVRKEKKTFWWPVICSSNKAWIYIFVLWQIFTWRANKNGENQKSSVVFIFFIVPNACQLFSKRIASSAWMKSRHFLNFSLVKMKTLNVVLYLSCSGRTNECDLKGTLIQTSLLIVFCCGVTDAMKSSKRT